MLTAVERARVRVVLVRARNPNNIGAVARAMHDFGFGDLVLVSEYLLPLDTARSAVDANDLLSRAASYGSLAEAIADCTLVLGTTAVGERVLEHPLATLSDAASELGKHLRAAPEHRVALLLGSEKTGLSNDELSHCHALVTIPMEQHEGMRHPSMNLGQAAAVCLYELVRDRPLHRPQPASAQAAAAETERLRALFTEVLETSGYTRRHPSNSDEAQLRRMLLRAIPTAVDAPVWMGILRQLLWALRRAPTFRHAPATIAEQPQELDAPNYTNSE